MSNTVRELPHYKCHKEVWALKIVEIECYSDINEAVLHFKVGFNPILVNCEYMEKHNPQVGGYYVVYDDGYISFSPAEVFEAGYTLIS